MVKFINRALSGVLYIIFLVVFLGRCTHVTQDTEKEKNTQKTTSLVDPFLGTGGHGHTFPGATRPFGMVQLSPDNGREGWDWSSGYHYSDSLITGFSHTHLSGTGIGDYCDISVMPFYGDKNTTHTGQEFSHSEEDARPGYYSVSFKNRLKVELTATDRVGIHRYTFHPDSLQNISIDLGFAINWDTPVETEIEIKNDTLLTGYRKSTGWAKQQWVYFAAVFNRPIKEHHLQHDTIDQHSKNVAIGKRVIGRFSFDNFDNNEAPLLIKVGISSVSVEGALNNIAIEASGWDFDKQVQEADNVWESALSKISANLIEPSMDTIFYSALYHTQIAPNLFSDQNGMYKGVDSIIHKAETYERYTVFSLWDTFRAAHPLFSILQPEKNTDFLKSFMAFYAESGLLPVWALSGNETNTMTGYHAIPVLTDAILKGTVEEEAIEAIYNAMLASADQDIRGTNYYRDYGYIPTDKDGWSVTKTLEYAYDDWCIAQVAKKLNKQTDYEKFIKRAYNYKALFDTNTLFMRGKDSKGNWAEPFDPYYSEHGFEGMYIEGTAWQHSWFVPHDVKGLIQLFGSDSAFVRHLDSTFAVTSKMTGENVSADISGLIGQYAHGNEPSHHIAYLYNYAGKPWKTQEKVRKIMTELYTTGADGLAGNDDCGQMSAWYIFSALGFYPVNPADGNYVIGSPLVKQAIINLQDGKKFKIIAENNSKEKIYVDKLFLNGKPLERSYITHKEIMTGGELRFIMSNMPNKAWASKSNAYPPSMSK